MHTERCVHSVRYSIYKWYENIETTSLGVAYLAGLTAGIIKNTNDDFLDFPPMFTEEKNGLSTLIYSLMYYYYYLILNLSIYLYTPNKKIKQIDIWIMNNTNL